MKRFFILLCMTLILISCQETNKISVEKTELVFRISWKAYSGRGEAISRIVDGFNESSDLYRVVMVGGDEDLEGINFELSDKKVDVLVLPYRYVQILGAADVLSPIELDTADLTISDTLLELGKVNEVAYGLPWVSHSMALLYNKTILEQAGVDGNAIRSREDFIKALALIENNTDSYGMGLVGANHNDLSWMVNQFIYGSGGVLIENDVIKINTEVAKEGLEFYITSLSQYAQPTWQFDTGVEVMDAFREQTIAFEIQGLWGITDIWKNGSPFEVGILPLKNIGAYSEVGPMMLSKRQDMTDEKNAGVEAFLTYMTSVEAQEKIMLGEYSPEHDQYYPFRLPVRDDILQSEFFSPYLIFETYIDAYKFPSIDVPAPIWGIIKEEIYTDYLHQLVLNEMTIDMFFDLVEEKGQMIIEEAK